MELHIVVVVFWLINPLCLGTNNVVLVIVFEDNPNICGCIFGLY